MQAGQEWDAGTNLEGPINQRGRWSVRREAHRTVVFFHFFFPKLEVILKAFEVEQEEAAKEYARQCCQTKTIPDRKQKG